MEIQTFRSCSTSSASSPTRGGAAGASSWLWGAAASPGGHRGHSVGQRAYRWDDDLIPMSQVGKREKWPLQSHLSSSLPSDRDERESSLVSGWLSDRRPRPLSWGRKASDWLEGKTESVKVSQEISKWTWRQSPICDDLPVGDRAALSSPCRETQDSYTPEQTHLDTHTSTHHTFLSFHRFFSHWCFIFDPED